MRNTLKWIFLVAVLITAFYFLRQVVNSSNQQVSELQVNDTLVNRTQSEGSREQVQEVSTATALFDTSNLRECEIFQQEYNVARRNWLNGQEQAWGNYLQEGYSLIDVTLVMARFTHPRLAAGFRAEQLRWQSEVAIYNRDLNQSASQSIEGFAASGMTFQRAIPLPGLDSFESMSESEKTQVLRELPVNVDDIAYFIYEGLPFEDITMMLDSIEDPQSVVNYDRHDIVSLFDYAVVASRPKIVEELLLRGMTPTEDEFLASSMDWALLSLSRYLQSERKDETVEVVKRLMGLGARARFESVSPSTVKGSFQGYDYHFNEEQLTSLRNDYQLDLTQIPELSSPLLDEEHPLLMELSQNLNNHLSIALGTEHSSTLRDECWETVTAISQQWNPRSKQEIYDELTEGLGEPPAGIHAMLSDIDPVLVDWYRTYKEHPSRQRSFTPFPQEVNELLWARNYDQAIEVLESHEFTPAESQSLFSQLLEFGPDIYPVLMSSSLRQGKIDYLQFVLRLRAPQEMQPLESLGADLRGFDERQKTLLFYAVDQMNSELVTYLVEEGFPYSFDDLGQDPLHAALRQGVMRGSITELEQTVATLMSYQPQVDEFHRNRLAVLRLKYPDVYQNLVSRYPQLAIDNNQPLPRVR
ncbi:MULTISPECIES: ankyrin repeat domain-containing protein [Gammaproteobacteria]|uniref:ankyrin repeat domain-containing protein n=1 Tax=Gammaproteobacteria TaxID=1236 RepID=UPI000DD0CEBD|nr:MULTISPECIES: ankyrin repeat domain-containing protein [Gammaproteobacteria]RTE86265.1 hypothetical protein DQX04_06765 [Aliidiomarina sp. B3213]TCZ91616.1 hypothetical protein EYQ95_06775 [Lysobacter sp. N42]